MSISDIVKPYENTTYHRLRKAKSDLKVVSTNIAQARTHVHKHTHTHMHFQNVKEHAKQSNESKERRDALDFPLDPVRFLLIGFT